MNKRFIYILAFIWPLILNAQQKLINAGPMPGYSEMKEVPIWLQTTHPAKVTAKYWVAGQPDSAFYTNTVITQKEKAFTALLVADSLEPGNVYEYDIYIDGQKQSFPYPTTFSTQQLWKWRTDPPGFSFLTGSGAYINEKKYDRPGTPYGDKYEIYDVMADRKANFMIWLGDNVYLREPDWNSRTGIIHRYTHDRALPQLQRFLASTQHYAILDDHDFGPNDSDRSFWNKNETLEAFQLFWANPSYGAGNIEGAITYFNYGDADFFLLDNRSYRSPNHLEADNKTELGEEQLQWLFDNLVSSTATFKFVVMGGQFLSTSRVYESYSNYGFDKERQKIIDFIYDNELTNVIFLTGDVHFSEISVLKQEGKPTIWDITSSPLNSGVNTNALNQNNTLRIPESVIMERNFAEVKITGPRKERTVTVSFYDYTGKERYTYKIKSEKVFKY
jgi:alkaline phosphatase D